MLEETSLGPSSGGNPWPAIVTASVSRVWPAYLQGVSDLWAYLESQVANIPDGTPKCNDYAASCCVLSILAWEGFALAWYEASDTPKVKMFKMTDVREIVGWPIEGERLDELIQLRDSLVHAHLVTTNLDPENTRTASFSRTILTGDRKAELNTTTARSTSLHLHQSPSALDRTDCRVVFGAMYETVLACSSSGCRIGGVDKLLYPDRRNDGINVLDWLKIATIEP